MSSSPLFFQDYQKGVFLGEALSEGVSASSTEMASLPIFEKMGRIKTFNSIPSANHFHAIANASNFVRCALPSSIVGGASLLGETSPLYGPIGVFLALDNYKQIKVNERIGDLEGANIERHKLIENVLMSVGTFSTEGVRAIGIASGLSHFISHTTSLSSAVMALQTFFNWFSGIFFAIYYALFSLRIIGGLVNLGRGQDLRAELLRAKDPIKALEELKKPELDKIRFISRSDLENIAVEEGALWLEKFAKVVKAQGKTVTWDESENSRKFYARKLLQIHPELMMHEMGAAPSFLKEIFEVNELARYGKFMAIKRMEAKLEAGYGRLLGVDAVAAAKSGKVEEFRELLVSPSWKKEAIKLALGLIGLVTVIAATALTGGMALAVSLVLFGITGVVWILISDGEAFKAQWASGMVKKRDKWIIGASVVLGMVALGGLIALSVMSGGAPVYLIGLILTTAWMVTNVRAVISLVRREIRPWDYSNVPTPEMFRKLIEHQPTDEKVEEVLKKMSDYNRQNLRELQEQNNNWLETAFFWEKRQKEKEAAAVDTLIREIQLMRPDVQ